MKETEMAPTATMIINSKTADKYTDTNNTASQKSDRADTGTNKTKPKKHGVQ